MNNEAYLNLVSCDFFNRGWIGPSGTCSRPRTFWESCKEPNDLSYKTMMCSHCGTKNIINLAKMKAVEVLQCNKCGAPL